MVKLSPSRNIRTRGVKVKNVLQICVLLAVCFWLIYQVKHSHDKKKAFDQSDVKRINTRVHDEILKFGRKDPADTVTEIKTLTEEAGDGEENEGEEDTKHEEEEEEVEDKHGEDEQVQDKHVEDEDHQVEEEEENKLEDEGQQVEEDHEHEEGEDHEHEEEDKKGDQTLEEEEQVEGNKHEDEEEKENEKIHENEDEGRVVGGGGGDDEIDEHELEAVHEAEDEKARETEAVERRRDQSDDSSEDHGAAHEAREENYQADDASSAVTHESETLGTGTEKGSSENSSGNQETVEEVKPNNTEEGTVDENEAPPNSTATEEKGFEMASLASNITEDGSSLTVSNDSTSEEKTDADGTEKSENGAGTDEVKHDPIDSSDSSVVLDKDVGTDLDILPETGTDQGGNSEDVAAE